MRLLLLFAVICSCHCKISNKTPENIIIDSFYDKHEKSLEGKRYKPDWNDLDTRPLPEWYDRAKIGIFLHWGIFSVPSFQSEWFWDAWKNGDTNITKFMHDNYPPGFTYQDFAPSFKAEFFEPDSWADLFKKAGANYVVLTSKHHEGFTLFPSNRSFSWNSVDVGPHRDLVGEVAKAVRDKDLVFGVYHSLYEWYNPMYLQDKEHKFATHEYRDHKLWPDIQQLIEDYKPLVLWSDGDWETTDKYWKSTDILAWLYNNSPVKDSIVVNDRWGIGTYCKHGDFYNCKDRYSPGVLQSHKWENAFTIDKNSWGYRRNMDLTEVMTIEELLQNVIVTVSCGGNALINVGPTKEGTIAPVFQERLLELGTWLSINGDAIYNTSPWFYQNDSTNGNVWYTCTKQPYNAKHPTAKPLPTDTVTAVYAMILKWPKNNVLTISDLIKKKLKDLDSLVVVEMLGQNSGPLNWEVKDYKMNIHLPDRATVVSQHAWTIKELPKFGVVHQVVNVLISDIVRLEAPETGEWLMKRLMIVEDEQVSMPGS